MLNKEYKIKETIENLSGPVSLRYLLEKIWLLPKKYVHFLRTRENVLVNGTYQSMNTSVDNGDVINMLFTGDEFRTAESSYIVDKSQAITILFENQYLVVVDKPAGIKSHPNQSAETGTLMNLVAGYLVAKNEQPFMVHRIDQQTSGAVIIAKTPVVVPVLDRLISSHDIKRAYLAVTDGKIDVDLGVINSSIGRDVEDKRKRMVNGENSQAAVTNFQVLSTSGKHSLVRLDLGTGRTHQIRVHLASIGAPIVGDPLYNASDQQGEMLLHGYELQLVLPFSMKNETIKVEIPGYFRESIVHYNLNLNV